jgi:hypothetical protein
MAEAVQEESALQPKDATAEPERPVAEAIRGGPTWIAQVVRQAFQQQFRGSDEVDGNEFLWINDFGPDYVLIESNHPDLKPGQLLKVPFTINADDSVTFPERGEWQVVEMAPTAPPTGRGEIAEEAAEEEQAEPGVAVDEPAKSEPVVESNLPSEELGTSEQLGAAEAAEVEPSAEEPGEGTLAEVKPSAEEPGETIPVEAEPSAEEPDKGTPAEAEPSAEESGEAIPAEVEPSAEEPGEAIPAEVEPSAEEPGERIPAEVEPSTEESGPAEVEPTAEEPGEGTPVEVEPSAEEPGEGIPAEVLEAAENDYAGQGRKIRESFDDGVTLVEAAEGQPRRIRGLLITADVVGINGRRYGHAVLQEAVAAGQRHLRESMSQGRAVLLGEAEHPSHKGGRPMFLETIVVWESLDYDPSNRQVWIEGRLIENTRGKDAIATMEAGVLPGLSLRGRGMTRTVTEEDNEFEDVIWVRFTGFDLVLNPSFADSAVTVLESDQAESSADVEAAPERELGTEPPNEENVMEPESTPAVEAVDLEAEKTKWTAEMQETAERQAEADRQAAEATETKKKLARLAELEEANARHEAENWLAEAMEEIDYPKNIRVRFEGMIGEPTTLEEAQRSFASAKEMVDAFIADMRLRSRGMTVENGVDVVGPVIEQADDSAPGFAAPAAAIAESIAQHRGKMRSDLANPRNINERLGRDYIARYDELYAHKLIQEAREWAEAETTTQLNLPYSVTRAVIEEAFPELIAASVFDVGVVNQSPLRIWYNQAFEGEAGSYGSITDESFTSSHDAWVSLAHKRITFGGVVITTNPAGTTYVEGTDYVIDYVEGRIKVLSTGSMADATGFLADYAYKEYRKGEGLGIERARTTLRDRRRSGRPSGDANHRRGRGLQPFAARPRHRRRQHQRAAEGPAPHR